MANESDDPGDERQANIRRPRSQLNTVDDDNSSDATDEETEEPSEEPSEEEPPAHSHVTQSSARREEVETSRVISSGRRGGNQPSGSMLDDRGQRFLSSSDDSSPPATYHPPFKTTVKRTILRKGPQDSSRERLLSKKAQSRETPGKESPDEGNRIRFTPFNKRSLETTENQDSPPAKKPRHSPPAPKRRASGPEEDPRPPKKIKTGAPSPDPDDADSESSSSESTSDIDPNRPAGQGRRDNDSKEAGSEDEDDLSDPLSDPVEETGEDDLSEDLLSEGSNTHEDKNTQKEPSGDEGDVEPSQDDQEDHDAQDNGSKKGDEADEGSNKDKDDERDQDDEGKDEKKDERGSSTTDSAEEDVEQEDQQEGAESSNQAAEQVRKSSRTGNWMYDDGTSRTNQDNFEQIARDAARDAVRDMTAPPQGRQTRRTRQQSRALSAQPEPTAPVQEAAPRTTVRAAPVRPSTAPDRGTTAANRATTRGRATTRVGRNPRQQSQPPSPQSSRVRNNHRGNRGRGAHGIHSRIWGVSTPRETPAPQSAVGQGPGMSNQPPDDITAAGTDRMNNALPSVEYQQEADEESQYEDAPEVPHQQAGESGAASRQSRRDNVDNKTLATAALDAIEPTHRPGESHYGRTPSRFTVQPRDPIRPRPESRPTFPPLQPLPRRDFNPNFSNFASHQRYMQSDEHSSFLDNASQRRPTGAQRHEVPSSAATDGGKTQRDQQRPKTMEKAKKLESQKEKEKVTKTSTTTKKGKTAKTATAAEAETIIESGETVAEQLKPELVSPEDEDKAFTIFVCGDNRLGQLALGDHVKEQTIPVINERLTAYELKDFDCGSSHCIALTQGGTVLTWGLGTEDSLALGGSSWQPDAIRKIPQPVNLTRFTEDGDEVVQVVATNDASFVLTREGRVLGWGCFKHPDPNPGPLRRLEHTYARPTEIKALRNIAMLAAGGQHLLALSEKGELFAMGWNHRGQHGMNPEHAHGSGSFDRVFCVEAFDKGKLASVRPAKIACGEHTSYLIDTKGKLYSWGENSQSQLGNDEKGGYEHVPAYRPVVNAAKKERRVVDVAGGAEHALACDKDGSLSAWGIHEATAFALPHSGRDSQTGQAFASSARPSSRRSPTKVPACNAVKSVAAGAHHSIVLDSRGEAFTYGVSKHYQTGQGPGNTMNIPQPEKLQEGDIKDYKVTRAAAGAAFTIFAARKVSR